MSLSGKLVHAMTRNKVRGVRTARRLLRVNEIVVVTNFGSRFRLRPADYIDQIVLRDGYYETEVLTAIIDGIPHGAVIWDVGANFGLHAITAKVMRPDLQIFCFEPSPEQAARILDNAALNSVVVSTVCLGLSYKTGLRTLHVQNTGNPGMSTFYPWDGTTYSNVDLRVAAGIGDILVEAGEIEFPSVVKLDVEGSEGGAIEGLKGTLSQGKTRLIFEGDDALVAIVKKSGYSDVRPLKRNEATEHGRDNFIAAAWVT